MKQIIIVGLLIMITIVGCTMQTQQPVGNNNNNNNNATQQAPLPSGNLGIKKDIAISGFAFDPATLTIPVGASVIWTNKDSVQHTIVSDSGNEINSDAISQGETYVHTFNTPGTYTYHCGIHPSMKGTIIVE